MTTPIISAEESIRAFNQRAEVLGGLRALLEWLEAHPTMPAPDCVRVQVSIVHGNEDARVYEVMRAAKLSGAFIDQNSERAISATLAFGPGAELCWYAAKDYGRAAHAAETSYRGAVTP